MTFVDLYRRGRIKDPEEEIHDAIESWHMLTVEDPPTLYEWLGLTRGQYASWVEQRCTITEILLART